MDYDDEDFVDWRKIPVPDNRPEGDWVNWKFGSGWFVVSGTSYYKGSYRTLAAILEFGREPLDPWRIELQREPDNRLDKNAVRVLLITKPSLATFWRKETVRILGYVQREAAAWLGENFTPDMPIACELKRLSVSPVGAHIRVCGLMPPNKERKRFARIG